MELHCDLRSAEVDFVELPGVGGIEVVDRLKLRDFLRAYAEPGPVGHLLEFGKGYWGWFSHKHTSGLDKGWGNAPGLIIQRIAKPRAPQNPAPPGSIPGPAALQAAYSGRSIRISFLLLANGAYGTLTLTLMLRCTLVTTTSTLNDTDLFDRYLDGETTPRLALAFGVSRQRISQRLRREFQKRYGYSPQNVKVIHYHLRNGSLPLDADQDAEMFDLMRDTLPKRPKNALSQQQLNKLQAADLAAVFLAAQGPSPLADIDASVKAQNGGTPIVTRSDLVEAMTKDPRFVRIRRAVYGLVEPTDAGTPPPASAPAGQCDDDAGPQRQ